MKQLKQLIYIVFLSSLFVSFSQCSSAFKVQEQAPFHLGQVYFQKWVGGVEGGGAGLNIFIPSKDDTVILDSVYFRGKAAKLEIKPQNELLFIGRFISDLNKKKDMIFHKEPEKEYGNKLPLKERIIPFDLQDDECVVSYRKGRKTRYFKIKGIAEKQMIAYPSPPDNKQ